MDGVAKACSEAGCNLIAAKNAEMPGVFSNNNSDLVGFSVGVVERTALLPRKDLMVAGDVLIQSRRGLRNARGFATLGNA